MIEFFKMIGDMVTGFINGIISAFTWIGTAISAFSGSGTAMCTVWAKLPVIGILLGAMWVIILTVLIINIVRDVT